MRWIIWVLLILLVALWWSSKRKKLKKRRREQIEQKGDLGNEGEIIDIKAEKEEKKDT
jgi:hypothetical protein